MKHSHFNAVMNVAVAVALAAVLLIFALMFSCAPIDPKCVVTCMAPHPPCEQPSDGGPR